MVLRMECEEVSAWKETAKWTSQTVAMPAGGRWLKARRVVRRSDEEKARIADAAHRNNLSLILKWLRKLLRKIIVAKNAVLISFSVSKSAS